MKLSGHFSRKTMKTVLSLYLEAHKFRVHCVGKVHKNWFGDEGNNNLSEKFTWLVSTGMDF